MMDQVSAVAVLHNAEDVLLGMLRQNTVKQSSSGRGSWFRFYSHEPGEGFLVAVVAIVRRLNFPRVHCNHKIINISLMKRAFS